MSRFIKLFDTQAELQAWLATYTGTDVIAAYARYDNASGEKEYEYSLTASMSQTAFEKTASTAILSIDANCTWNITTMDNWIHFDIVSGAGSADVTVSIDATEEDGPRIGGIYVNYGGGMVPFDISQEGAGQPANQFWYKSNDGEIITPNSNTFFGTNGNALSIVSNTYVNGQGVITFSGDIAELGSDIFRWAGADRLIEASIPASVTKIGGNAFNTCIFSAFTIPDSVVEIGQGAFMWSNVRELIIPASVQRMGGPCYQCQQLTATSIYATSVPEYLETPSYGYFGINKPINVPSNLVDAYKAADGWSFYANNIVGTLPPVQSGHPDEMWIWSDSEVTEITNWDLNLPVDIDGNPVGVESISYDGEKYIVKLTGNLYQFTVEIVSSTSKALFRNMTGITSIELPTGLINLPPQCFSGCNGLGFSPIPAHITKLGAQISWKPLTELTVPATVTTLGIYSSTKGYGPFAGTANSGLETIIFESTVPPALSDYSMSSSFFYQNSSLQHIYVPASSVSTYQAFFADSGKSDLVAANPNA